MPTIPLTRDRIVEEAIALVDEEGAAALSMRRLAARLGTSTMSTYHHLPDKQALREAIAVRIMSELAEPAPDTSWDEALREMA
jgi:AcrR family transcriptional regulator